MGSGNPVFPAHAGMNRCSSLLHIDKWRVPRACGDEPVAAYSNSNSIIRYRTPTRRYQTLTDFELLAVTAMVRNLTLVTRNVEDFADFLVKVLNPWNHG